MKDDFRIEHVSFRNIDLNAPRGPCENLEAAASHLSVERNYFRPLRKLRGPYRLEFETIENRLGFHIGNREGEELPALYISFNPYRKLIGDYYILCDSYQLARDNASPSRLEAIDMGRRALHNEGADLLTGRLAHHIEMDLPTARRIFTIMCVMHGRPGPH